MYISKKFAKVLTETQPQGATLYGEIRWDSKYYVLFDSEKPGIYTSFFEMKDNKRIPTTYAKCFNTLSEAEDYYLKWEKTAVAYTDGSYSPDRGKYSYGVAIYNAGGEYHLSGRPNDPDMAKFANLAGEAEAVAMAVSFCKDRGVEKLTVFHDFDQLPGWARGEHPTLPVAARLHKSCAASGVDLSFVKVKAHSSNKGNFKADALAKSVLLPRRAYS